MTAAARSIDILMYHSISNEDGPTRISPNLFKQQIDALSECGCTVAPLRDVARWHRGEIEFSERTIVLTFDDAFADFHTNAHPVLSAHNYPATVFVPTSRVGGFGNWDRPNMEVPSDQLMTWKQIRDLSERGIDMGSHSVSHTDLSKLRDAEVRKELEVSRDALERELGKAPACFAPPFGHTTPEVVRKIRDYYDLSVGTRLAKATRQDNLYDLPRIEMHYFRDMNRWRDHLKGQGQTYLTARKSLRVIKLLARKIAPI